MHSNYKERGLFPHNPTKSSALDLPALLVKIVLPGNEIETSFFPSNTTQKAGHFKNHPKN